MFDVLSCATYLGYNPEAVAGVTRLIVTVIKIVVPILLVIFGMLDLAKAVIAQKEDEIKKGQQTLIKRAIAAAIVFFVVSIVQLIFGVLLRDSDDRDSIQDCINCFINSSNNC